MTTPTQPWTPPNLGPNDRAPCGSASARRRHIARLERCPLCHVDGIREAT